MAFVIDRVDVLGYLASDAAPRDVATGTLVARLSGAAAFDLHETVPDGSGKPLDLAVWEPGFDLVVRGGSSIQTAPAVGAQI